MPEPRGLCFSNCTTSAFIVDPNGNLQKELIGPQTQESLEEIIKALEQDL